MMTDAEISRLKRLIRASPDSLRFVSLGEALRCRGDLDEAHKVLCRGLRYHPNLHSGQSILARVFAERGEPHRALPLVSGLLERDPDDRSLRVLMVELLIAVGHRREATAALAEVPNTDPRRERLSARLRSPNNTDPFATRELALRLERAGRLVRAAVVWETIARHEPASDASDRARELKQRAAHPGELEVVPLRDERSHTQPGRAARSGHLRRLLALLRRAEQEM